VTMSAYGLTEATSLAATTIPGVDEISDIVDSVGRAALGAHKLRLPLPR
jgi:hypothetical protein